MENKLLTALNRSPLVFLRGPRQVGKSTLAQHIIGKDFSAEYITFDNMTQMDAAASASEIFPRKRTDDALILDEVQMVPEVFRTLKITLNELHHKHGEKFNERFLLTSSTNIIALPKLANSLVNNRMELVNLYPLSGVEATGGNGDFINRLFNKDFKAGNGKHKLMDVMYAATFPKISGATASKRADWFDDYLITVLQSDIRSLSEIERVDALPNLLRNLASRIGSQINDAEIARDVKLNHVTSRNYKALLRMLFLTFDLSPIYRTVSKRLVRSPKCYLVDTLLLCHLLQYEPNNIEKNRPELFIRVIENFIATEILKLIESDYQKLNLLYFKTSDEKKVSFVVEKPDGKLVAVEFKKSDSVSQYDFKDLQTFQELMGTDFVCGVVLYCGNDVISFGKNLWAIPMESLWA
jgi:predicted AAA+ superfamily ATPase